MPDNQPLDESQLQALLRLKRFEQPPPGYFDDLLHRVHQRQREELLRVPRWRIALDRIAAYFAPLRIDWAHAASMAALLIIGVAAIRIALPERTTDNPGSGNHAALAANPGAAPGSKTGPMLDQNPNLPSDSEKRAAAPAPDAPTRFIIDTQPVSYEAKQIRF